MVRRPARSSAYAPFLTVRLFTSMPFRGVLLIFFYLPLTFLTIQMSFPNRTSGVTYRSIDPYRDMETVCSRTLPSLSLAFPLHTGSHINHLTKPFSPSFHKTPAKHTTTQRRQSLPKQHHQAHENHCTRRLSRHTANRLLRRWRRYIR